MNRTLLQMAVARRRNQILAAAETENGQITVDTREVLGEHASPVVVRPVDSPPGILRLAVLAVGKDRLFEGVTVDLPARQKTRASFASGRPKCIRLPTCEWTLVDVPGQAQEILKRGPNGCVFQAVDTETYCYRMVCECGEVRYASPSSIHQVDRCRACTQKDRLRRKAEKARAAYHGKST